MKKRKFGFTLAEVLIALTVIGVISAVTVPVLMRNTNKQEYVTALKKTYSTLSQVTNQIIAEEGSPKTSGNDKGWLQSVDDLYDMYKKRLNNVKECGSGAGCFTQHYNYLGGGSHSGWNTYGRRLVLADGVQIMFNPAGLTKGCNHSMIGGSKDYCAEIFIDVNGVKPPNTYGRDAFWFVLKENGLFPWGCDTNEKDCSKLLSGYGCTCKVLREDAINY